MKSSAVNLLENTLQNPLIKGLPHFLTSGDMAEKLASQPCSKIDWVSLPIAKRAPLLNMVKETFCVTETSLRIATGLQSLLWDGLIARDPRLPEHRRLLYQIAEYDPKKFEAMPWRDEFIGGLTIRGITGVGKSAAVNRYLSLLPQVIRHGANEDAHWIEFCQLVYLKVPMSADGSRGGFLQNCLREMDNVMGTDYYKKHQGKSWTVERLLVNVLHYLALHRCGLLVIEEAQEKNLAGSQFAREFLTFFLRLLNHGIPVAIVGNPLAFSVLDSFSQDQSRFSEYGDFKIGPTYDFRDEEWCDVWIVELWGTSILDQNDEPIKDICELIWTYTAGFPRFVARLRRETLAVAIQMNSTRVCKEHIEIANRSPAMDGSRKLVSAFVKRDWRDLEQFLDIPIAEIRLTWSLMNVPQGTAGDSPVAQTQGNVGVAATADPSKVREENRKLKKRKVEKIAQPKKAVSTLQEFDSEDIRSKQYVDR